VLTARVVLRMMSGALMARPNIGGLVEVQRPMENLLTLGTCFYDDLCSETQDCGIAQT